MKSISLTLNFQEKNVVHQKLAKYAHPTANQYVQFLYKYKNYTITLYKSGSLVIQGDKSELAYKEIFKKNYVQVDLEKQNLFQDIDDLINQEEIITIGSDEVGVGDFFGGLVVCAVKVMPHQINKLKALGVTDSKKLTDEAMLTIYAQLIKIVAYDVQLFSPKQYNDLIIKYQNSHILKAILHNQALATLSKSTQAEFKIIVDQFASSKNYYSYLKQANLKPVTVNLFTTNAEQKFIAVACASIIARIAFLKQMKDLSQTANVTLPLGASSPSVKQMAIKIGKQAGIDVLQMLVKVHFKTYQEVISAIKA